MDEEVIETDEVGEIGLRDGDEEERSRTRRTRCEIWKNETIRGHDSPRRRRETTRKLRVVQRLRNADESYYFSYIKPVLYIQECYTMYNMVRRP